MLLVPCWLAIPVMVWLHSRELSFWANMSKWTLWSVVHFTVSTAYFNLAPTVFDVLYRTCRLRFTRSTRGEWLRDVAGWRGLSLTFYFGHKQFYQMTPRRRTITNTLALAPGFFFCGRPRWKISFLLRLRKNNHSWLHCSFCPFFFLFEVHQHQWWE